MRLKIIPFGFILLICLMFVVSANMTNKGNDVYEVKVFLSQGWNIVAGTVPSEGLNSDSQIQINDISAMWYYSPIQNRYIEVHPSTDWEALNDDDDDFVLINAMWIYSEKPGFIEYSTLEQYPSLSGRNLYGGWNFVTITPDMLVKKWNEIKGNCEITKLALWEDNDWDIVDLSILASLPLADQNGDVGRGLVVKVAYNCVLGESSIIPPQLP